ncbi:MAG TPA: pitrilysin family protein [Candidatus Nanoarchaeia archaeon]|nr:pitrilysin family protein [Candidatus Nanoarchaeia archaeon]
MQKFKLKNGITVIFDKNSSKSVAVEVMVRVGSNNENESQAGLSHFLEHMLFEGTKTRKDSREIANEIEKYGGEFNAYTTGDRTAYFIKIINKQFEKALEILSDMVINSAFDEKIMEKEKQVILKEINMVTDDPRLHQWVLFQKNLFEKHPAKNPTYGTVKAVKGFSRKTLVDYYSEHYVSKNMILSISGNISDAHQKAEKYFGKMRTASVQPRNRMIESPQQKEKKVVEKRKTLNSYLVVGYKTVPRLHKHSYVFDVIHGIIGRGQSGWMFDEIRNKRGLAYQVGIQNEMEIDYGMFAVYCGLDKSKIEKAKEIMMQQFNRLQTISEKDLEEAKNYIEGNFALQTEDNFHRADNVAYWETIKDAALADSYIKNIRRVTTADVKAVAKKYFTGNYTIVVIEQK